MKRYRIINVDFDSRVAFLDMKIDDSEEENIKEQHRKNKAQIIKSLLKTFGESNREEKLKNLIDLGCAPFSILAFHNKFQHQIRNSFVMGSYYPALTATCSLGERILNHLILLLKDEFKGRPEYKKVYKKKSFDDWSLAIKTLSSWKILLPNVAKNFEKLKKIRHREAIHFNPITDTHDREIALKAIKVLSAIIQEQFSGGIHGGFKKQPWFIENTKGAFFIKKKYEVNPFIKKIYLPNCDLVGPLHEMEQKDGRWFAVDDHNYEDKEISDKEFVKMLESKKCF